MNVPRTTKEKTTKEKTNKETNKETNKKTNKETNKEASKGASKETSMETRTKASKEGSKKIKESNKEASPCVFNNNIHVPTRLDNKDSDLLRSNSAPSPTRDSCLSNVLRSTANSLRSRSTASSFDVGIDDSKQWIHQLERELRPSTNSFDLDQIPKNIKKKNNVELVLQQHVLGVPLDDDNISSTQHSAVALCTF